MLTIDKKQLIFITMYFYVYVDEYIMCQVYVGRLIANHLMIDS